ncbi:OsmC family protein [Micromonospora cathayae]|uniref:OsmC family protein n=1 Tax=Micromonospora cathayae TaxID=3028804 RepID=A0ABY7ZPN2_9ACTN|nr:OsmC family protein [Micromonospora sp. HUAS 3]WDZ84386.1 OsmC family protein [Micromonospora sp. HUAS 3]
MTTPDSGTARNTPDSGTERKPYVLALRTTEVVGRFTATGADTTFTIDNSKLLEKPEHPGTAEYFLASLAGCALNIIAARSVEWELPYPRLELDASYLVDADDSTRFERIGLRFRFTATPAEQSRRYVDDFTARCPIYNTLVRGGTPITIEVQVDS